MNLLNRLTIRARFHLMIGIVTSLFTGVFCSKVVFDWIVRGLKVRRLPVG